MAYTENIPQSFTNPSQDQPLILGNFIEIETAFNLNHGHFNDPEQGKHLFLQMPEQATAPVTGANEAAFYSRESPFTDETELVFKRESNGSPGKEIEFTGLLEAENGWTRLPSGILLKWGRETGPAIGVGAFDIEFPTGATIPPFITILNAMIMVEDQSPVPDTFVTFQTFNKDKIAVFASSRTSTTAKKATVRYLAIGI